MKHWMSNASLVLSICAVGCAPGSLEAVSSESPAPGATFVGNAIDDSESAADEELFADEAPSDDTERPSSHSAGDDESEAADDALPADEVVGEAGDGEHTALPEAPVDTGDEQAPVGTGDEQAPVDVVDSDTPVEVVDADEPVGMADPDAPVDVVDLDDPTAVKAERPLQVCASALEPKDVSRPTTVVGNGTPASCSESALRAAVSLGGVITFNCGSAITTIALTQPLEAQWDRDTVIDGGDRVVLDGQNRTQILRAFREHFRNNDNVLTVQRLVMTRGNDPGSDFVARDGDKLCAWGYKSGGGGAIYTRDMSVHVWGVTFLDNHGPLLGPDVAGGAIYMLGSKELVIANSVFRGNSAANGGAIGMLHTAATLTNVLFDGNSATGTNANFAGATGCPVFAHEEQGGAGGLGGAFYSDGFNDDSLCGVRMANNSSGDMGGAVFRSAYWGLLSDVARQQITWDRCELENNHSVRGGGGAAYLNNSLFTVTNTTFAGNDAGEGDGGALKLTGLTLSAANVSFTDNAAGWAGGVAHWGAGPEGAGTSTSVTFAGNAPNDTAGVYPQ
jgi:hypothetical protein